MSQQNRNEMADESAKNTTKSKVSRRAWLKASAMGVVGASTLGTGALSETTQAASTDPGDPSPARSEVGGGESYTNKVTRSDANRYVTSSDPVTAGNELENHIDNASPSDIIWIDSGVTADITDVYAKNVPAGVTIASDRGRDGSRGGKILIGAETSAVGVLQALDNVRITGVQFEGPSIEHYSPNDLWTDAVVGVFVEGTGVEIDNCEFWGFTNAGVRVGHLNNEVRTVNTHIHHCSFHHNAMQQLGYGVVVGWATVNTDLSSYHGRVGCLIEYNYFNRNRHSIAGNGSAKSNYTACYNIQGPDNYLYTFDMHGTGSGGTGGTAGGTLRIHNNTFKYVYRDKDGERSSSIGIRGMPEYDCDIHHNWFHNDYTAEDSSHTTGEQGTAINQVTADWGTTDVYDNHYGQSEPPAGVGAPSDGSNLSYDGNATAVDASVDSNGEQSAIEFSVTNDYGVTLNITDVTIETANPAINELSDHTMEEGKWKSELYVDADLQDSAVDVNDGLTLPGSIDLKNDGHSESDKRWAVLSSGTTAWVYLYQFEDDGVAVDMVDEGVTFVVDYYLDDGEGTTGTKRFTLAP
ncbi:hypothetical protein [Haladaptatus cibarius]|uniref:hypothetical protein n=1 Tax=Haladaptatus cibarius TaxID=453847 RepID=UPI0006786C7D|nr:hypothetical protein [Haladaptatus cibarius]